MTEEKNIKKKKNNKKLKKKRITTRKIPNRQKLKLLNFRREESKL